MIIIWSTLCTHDNSLSRGLIHWHWSWWTMCSTAIQKHTVIIQHVSVDCWYLIHFSWLSWWSIYSRKCSLLWRELAWCIFSTSTNCCDCSSISQTCVRMNRVWVSSYHNWRSSSSDHTFLFCQTTWCCTYCICSVRLIWREWHWSHWFSVD